ncbi:MAG TPA: hypothetical protein VE978_12710 [Chitinophagales bacterium]|nr:hypothetical protein [Chitinophagales bacterium]
MLTTHEANSSEENTPIQHVKVTAVHGNWILQKEKLIEKFGLTYAELAFKDGKKDEMLAKLQMKLGISKGDLAALIAAL